MGMKGYDKKNIRCWLPPLKREEGQSFLEFTFGTIMTVLLMIGMIKVFIWLGADQVKQMDRHEASLIQDCGYTGACPVKQLSPRFFQEDGFGELIPGDYIYGEYDHKFDEYVY